MLHKKKMQTYNDGVVKIYSVSSDAAPGDRPTEKTSLKETLPYEERTVGLTRYMAAKQDGVEIKKILRCPRRETVSPEDVAVPIDNTQYSIAQIQYPMDVTPDSMDLVLELVEVEYEI